MDIKKIREANSLCNTVERLKGNIEHVKKHKEPIIRIAFGEYATSWGSSYVVKEDVPKVDVLLILENLLYKAENQLMNLGVQTK